MTKYIIQGETLKAIADEVRDLTDITDEINPNEMIANMEQANADVAAQTEIIEQIRTALDGKAGSNAAEIGALIDQSGVLDSTEGTVEEKVEQLVDYASFKAIIQESLYANYNYSARLFRGTRVKDVSMFDFSKTQNLSYGFIGSKLETLVIDASNVANMQDMCADCKNLKSVVFTNETFKVSNIINAFNGCSSLETINILDVSNCVSLGAVHTHRTWGGCGLLKEIRFVENCIKVTCYMAESPLLSAESVQSIFDGLATVETAQTLTLHKNAKILQSQVDSANAKGWTVAGGTVVSEEEYYG